jgi:gustatory receptor
MHTNISEDFYMAIRPLLHVSRALGLAPLAYVRKPLPGGKTSFQLVESSAALAYSIFVVVLYLCVFAVSITFKIMYVYSLESDTEAVTDILLHTITITALISIAVSVTKNRGAILRITDSITEIDSITLPCCKEYYSKANTILIYQLLVICIFLGLAVTFDTFAWRLSHGLISFAYCHMYIDTLIEWIVVIQFISAVILLKNRFSILNTCLFSSSCMSETENVMQGFHFPLYNRTFSRHVKEMKPHLTRKEIMNLNNTHDKLVDAVHLVISTYELQILFSLLSTFVGITTRSYALLCDINGYRGEISRGTSVSILLSHTLWCSLHMAKLLCITIPCHSANNNMAHTSTVLRKLLLAFHTDPATTSELERLSQHIALRKFKFTVFGFLSLDLSLLVSMMGAVTSYLVILMQFRINPN